MPVKFILFDISAELVDKWREAFQALVPEECKQNVTIIHSSLDTLTTPFDCIVSPANSFGRLDGSFDQVLSDTFAPASDPSALTRTAQSVLYEQWRGFAPPGTCTLIPLANSPCANNARGCRFVALCPTMRIPQSVTWHREIVYNCVWSLLVAIDAHNARVRARAADGTSAGNDLEAEREIEAVAMTGLATGVGRVPMAVCAKQTALAFAHFHEATTNPEKWSTLEWKDVLAMPLNPRLPMDEPHRGGIRGVLQSVGL